MRFADVKKLFIPEGEVRRIERGGDVLWKGGYTNLIPMAIDTDGSVYEGKGYIEDYRLSSSGSLSEQAGTVTTGFIPCRAGDLIRMGGALFASPAGNCYLAFYDAGFALLGSINCYPSSGSSTGYATTSRGIVTQKSTGAVSSIASGFYPTVHKGVTVFDWHGFTDGSKVAYFRVNGVGRGGEMVVTVNEEIEG